MHALFSQFELVNTYIGAAELLSELTHCFSVVFVVFYLDNDSETGEEAVVHDMDDFIPDLKKESEILVTDNTSGDAYTFTANDGDQFMATKPWLGAIVAPLKPPSSDSSQPGKLVTAPVIMDDQIILCEMLFGSSLTVVEV